jgi:hypothetical protein
MSVMAYFRQLADSGIMVITTIHQPRPDIWGMLDKVGSLCLCVSVIAGVFATHTHTHTHSLSLSLSLSLSPRHPEQSARGGMAVHGPVRLIFPQTQRSAPRPLLRSPNHR